MHAMLRQFDPHTPVALCAAVICLAVCQSPILAQSIQVDAPARVSPPGIGGHFFGFGNTKTDPEDSMHVITCGMHHHGPTNGWRGYVYSSHDGGRRWHVGLIDSSRALDSSYANVSEVSCAIGPRGRTYLVTEAWNPDYLKPTRGSGVFRLYHSSDGERTWSKPVTKTWHDHSRSAVDNTRGEYHGRLYIFGNDDTTGVGRAGNVEMKRASRSDARGLQHSRKPLLVSDDGGVSLRGPVYPPADERYQSNYPSEAVVLDNGSVIAVYGSSYKGTDAVTDTSYAAWFARARSAPRLVEVVVSRDGGRTLDTSVAVRRSTRARLFGSYHTAIAVAPKTSAAFPGRIFVTWSEREREELDAQTQIMLAWSDDNGRSWSEPVVVSDNTDRRGSPVNSALAVNPAGVVGIMWVEQGGRCWRFAASKNGGASFAPSVPLHACAPPPAPGPYYRHHLLGISRPSSTSLLAGADWNKVGFTVRADDWSDVGGLAASMSGVFHATWSTRSSDGALWTTRIVVGAPPRPLVSLEGLELLATRAVLAISEADYDDATGEVVADVALINADTAPINGPLVLAVTSLQSSLGSITLVNSDGGGNTVGALVKLNPSSGSSAGADNRSIALPPGGRTLPRRLVFRIGGIDTARRPDRLSSTTVLVSITADVYRP